MSLSWGLLAEIRDLWVPPRLRRRLSLMLAFLGFGLIAGTSGVALIVADTDTEPRSAFAFTPVQTPTVATTAPEPNVEGPLPKVVLAREVIDSNGTTREVANRENVKACPSTPYASDNRCGSGAASISEIAAPVSNSSASTVVPRGDDSEGTIIAEPQPAASGESAPVLEVSATPPTDFSSRCGRSASAGSLYHKAAKDGAPAERPAPCSSTVLGMVRLTSSSRSLCSAPLLAVLVRAHRLAPDILLESACGQAASFTYSKSPGLLSIPTRGGAIQPANWEGT